MLKSKKIMKLEETHISFLREHGVAFFPSCPPGHDGCCAPIGACLLPRGSPEQSSGSGVVQEQTGPLRIHLVCGTSEPRDMLPSSWGRKVGRFRAEGGLPLRRVSTVTTAPLWLERSKGQSLAHGRRLLSCPSSGLLVLSFTCSLTCFSAFSAVGSDQCFS